LIGWSAADPKSVFRGIPLSRPRTAHHQLRRLHELGLHVTVIASHRDIDTIDDLRAVTTRYPRLRVAAVAS
jgi:glycosyltransferase A (GT-A) superfamily protein (DUF2064 family)